jgi:arylsulfatase A-like enzyme
MREVGPHARRASTAKIDRLIRRAALPRSQTRAIVLARMRRRLLPLAALALAAACRRDALPPRVTVEDVVADLAPPLVAGATVTEPTPGAVRPGVLQPGDPLAGAGPRPSLVAPPPAVVRMTLEVPDGAALRFSAAVDGDKKRDDARSGVTFRVTVDGEERFAESVNPAARRRHRSWLDGHVDLRREAGRRVEVAFETRADDPARPLAGTPGWSHVRLVRETTRDRQRANAAVPNLLVLLVDTLRADRLGVYGAQPSPSPTLDQLAARGVVFADSVSQSSWTMPSVSTLLTGLYPRTTGAIGQRSGPDAPADLPGTAFLGDGVVTWAELAQRAGITTVGVSANPLVSRATNFAQGFETFVELPWDWRAHDWPRAGAVNQAFVDWLGHHRAWRFVAYLHYMEPHDPYTPPAALRPAPTPPGLRPAVAAGTIDDLAKAINFRGAPGLSDAEIAWLRRLYDAEIRSWDDALAALLRGLESAGVLESTLVVVTADHGEEFQEHGRLKHGSHLYEESIHVPLVVAGPGVTAVRRTDTAQGIDLLPTLAGRLGLPAPAGLPGRDLFATSASGDAISETGSGIAPDGSFTDVVALRTPQWKLIRTPALERIELYDLAHDPGERTNDATNGEAVTLGAVLDRWAAAAPQAPLAGGNDPALRAKLRALGYVE